MIETGVNRNGCLAADRTLPNLRANASRKLRPHEGAHGDKRKVMNVGIRSNSGSEGPIMHFRQTEVTLVPF